MKLEDLDNPVVFSSFLGLRAEKERQFSVGKTQEP